MARTPRTRKTAESDAGLPATIPQTSTDVAAVEVDISSVEAESYYNVELLEPAKVHTMRLMPRDKHQVLGSAISEITPQEAIKRITKV